ncbi:MAG: NERD domain-containing protein [Anaerostipes sp.]|jgi:ribosomal protein S27AE
MGKGLIDILLDNIFDADWKGRRGEKLIKRKLSWVKLFGRNGEVLRNVYVPKDDGRTFEIDVVFITQKGIFVIESKNYSGWIFGNEKDANWTVMLQNKTKNYFYNPVKQNRAHIKWLGSYLSEEVPLFSIIVFSERCELKKVTVISEDIPVIKRDRLYATIRSIWNKNEDKLTKDKVNEIYEKLRVLTNADEATKQVHIDAINSRYKKQNLTLPKAEDKLETEKKICPRCGAELVFRMAKRGNNAGNQFYGCSAFPKCRYIEKKTTK